MIKTILASSIVAMFTAAGIHFVQQDTPYYGDIVVDEIYMPAEVTVYIYSVHTGRLFETLSTTADSVENEIKKYVRDTGILKSDIEYRISQQK
ncbi:MAG: hypothetical protein U9R60_14635 [Bacteroidota bacterium]|nr:hypothetical protein [Bacteroidota bacterium]